MCTDSYDHVGALLVLARIDVAEGAFDDAGRRIDQADADGMTTRIVRQVSGIGGLDTARGRSDRVFGTALDTAWARATEIAR